MIVLNGFSTREEAEAKYREAKAAGRLVTSPTGVVLGVLPVFRPGSPRYFEVYEHILAEEAMAVLLPPKA